MLWTASLFLMGSKKLPVRTISKLGCLSSVVALVAVIVGWLTIAPESWSDQEKADVLGNLMWVATMPGVLVFSLGKKLRRPT